VTAEVPGLIELSNVPRLIATVVATRAATLHELQTVYGLEDAYDLLEMATVEVHNQRAIKKWQQKS